jgi:hypothetical protein
MEGIISKEKTPAEEMQKKGKKKRERQANEMS